RERVSSSYGATQIWEWPESMRATNAIARPSLEKRACIKLYLGCWRIWTRSCEASFSRLMVNNFCGDMKSISTFLLSLDQSEITGPQSSQRISAGPPTVG